MTQEDKELLLKDLCARLPYRVRIKREVITDSYVCFEFNLSLETFDKLKIGIKEDRFSIKPYLRPMSSMTTKEKKEILNLLGYDVYICEDFSLLADSASHIIQWTLIQTYVDWLNEHHFDYRGLIEKGLALEAPEDMYGRF